MTLLRQLFFARRPSFALRSSRQATEDGNGGAAKSGGSEGLKIPRHTRKNVPEHGSFGRFRRDDRHVASDRGECLAAPFEADIQTIGPRR